VRFIFTISRKLMLLYVIFLLPRLALANPILQANGTGSVKVLSSAIYRGSYLQDGRVLSVDEVNHTKMYCEVQIYNAQNGDELAFDDHLYPNFSRDFSDPAGNFSSVVISAISKASSRGIYMTCRKEGLPHIFDTSEVAEAVKGNLSVGFNFSEGYDPNALNLTLNKPFSFLVGKTIYVDPNPYAPRPYIKNGKLLSWTDVENAPILPYILINKLFYGPPVQYEVGTKLDVGSISAFFNIPYDSTMGFKTRTSIVSSSKSVVRELRLDFYSDNYSEYSFEDLNRECGDVLKVIQ